MVSSIKYTSIYSMSLIIQCRRFYFVSKVKLLAVIFLFISTFTYAQNQSESESDYHALLVEEVSDDLTPQEYMTEAFNLLKKSTKEKNDNKIRYALYSIGQSYYDMGKYSKAIEYCNKALEHRGSDNYNSNIYATRVKSFAYNALGLESKSFTENKKALELASTIKNKNTDGYHIIKGLLYRDKGTYYTDVDSILKYDRKNLEEFLKLKKVYTKSAGLSMPYNNVGYDYLLKENLDSAFFYYKKAYYYTKLENDEYNFTYAYQSFGEYYEAAKKPDSALYFYKKSLDVAEKFKDFKMAKSMSENIRALYLKMGDKDNSIKYNEIFSRLNDSIALEEKKELNKVVSSIEKDKDKEFTKSNKIKYLIIGILLLSMIIIITYAVYQYLKNKKDYQKFIKIISDLEKKSLSEHEKSLIEEIKDPSITPVLSISDDRENALLINLKNFEKKEQFLSHDISLASLAAGFNTNVNYLSRVIKKYKNNNFNGYINELRINYITNKLKLNPEYHHYKIAYLAEECGFSSYSYFVNIFKQQTGLTPSKFIDYLKKEEQLSKIKNESV